MIICGAADLMCYSTQLPVECHVYNSVWSESTVSWTNTSPNNYNSAILDSHTVYYRNGNYIPEGSSYSNTYEFDILTAVRGWKSGTYNQSSGIIFKTTNAIETGSTNMSACFASYERSSNKPKLFVTYSNPVSAESVSIAPVTVSLDVGAKRAILATVLPSNSTNKNVIWSSGNTDIATINPAGTITGVNPGIVKITCHTVDGNLEPTVPCTVTVNPTSYILMSEKVNYSRTISAGRYYWFKFTPAETGTYLFESRGTTDTYGILYQGTNQLIENDDGGDGSNFKITYRLIAGVEYRLLVRGWLDTTVGSFIVKIVKGWPEPGVTTINARSDWGARDPIESRLVPRTRSPQRIVFHHSADKFSSTAHSDIVAEIKRIQNLHMDKEGKCDIAYHFIIDPSGTIWKGAEIDGYQRGHAAGYFDDIGVLILGDFESRVVNLWNPNTLNQQQKDAMISLSKYLCYKYNLLSISSGQDVAPISIHRIVQGDTVCPGGEAAPWIENELQTLIFNWRL